MTTDIERQFFDTFGIEPKWGTVCNHCDCQEFEKAKFYYFDKGICCGCHHSTDGFYYPQISDRILLEMIRLGLNYDFVIHSKSVEELKEKLLALLMYNKAEFKQRVQTLFKEG